MKPITLIQSAVFDWYAAHGRHDLPWRRLSQLGIDPGYGVLVSEIMLQQTQVDRVAPKFRAFIHYFPTVQLLAKARPAQVITLWSGLGYNRRAILLQRAAQEIVAHYDGVVPNDPKLLIALPGVGPYTAAAIGAFAFNLPCVVIDTNIRRFYELLFFGYKKVTPSQLIKMAQGFIPIGRSCEWHSGLMDLMSQVRTAKTPAQQQRDLLDRLNLTPAWKMPKLTAKALARPKQTAFRHSRRYFRGQIMALLRQQPHHRVTLSRLAKEDLFQALPPDYSLADLLAGLKKDRLIDYREPLRPLSRIHLP